MHRKMGAPSLVEVLLPPALGRNDRLERIDHVVDWDTLGKLVAPIYSARHGKPSYPPLTMVKVLVLQQWYNLSDPEMEAALGDRLSFRRFVGLGLQDSTPDHSTISRFRKQLTNRDLASQLFEEVGRQLEERGLVVKQGTILDATVVEAQVRRPPISRGPGGGSETDPEAGWTRKGNRWSFGYKVHVGMDADSGLLRTAQFTSATVLDTEVADALVKGDEAAVYADRAYESTARRRRLKSQGINDRVMHRSHKHQGQLPHWQQRRNALISRVRARVEKVFGTWKRVYGYRQVRYLGLERNATEMWFKCLYNLRRADRLLAVA